MQRRVTEDGHRSDVLTECLGSTQQQNGKTAQQRRRHTVTDVGPRPRDDGSAHTHTYSDRTH